VSFYEYWIGKNINLDAVWRDYEEGSGYERKFRQIKCYLLQIEFENPPAADPLFSFEAVFKTTRRYFHDVKQSCLSPREYDEAAPLYFYGVMRGSAIWQWLGELRQLLLFGTTLGDEKVIGQTLDNLDKKLAILHKYFGSDVNPKDFDAFMRAKAAPEIEAAVRKMLRHKIKRVSISARPIDGSNLPADAELLDMKQLETKNDGR